MRAWATFEPGTRTRVGALTLSLTRSTWWNTRAQQRTETRTAGVQAQEVGRRLQGVPATPRRGGCGEAGGDRAATSIAGHLDEDIYNVDAPHTKKQCGLTPEERASWTRTLEEVSLRTRFGRFTRTRAGWYSYWSGRRAGNRPRTAGCDWGYFAASERIAAGAGDGVRVVDSFVLDKLVAEASDHAGGDHPGAGLTHRSRREPNALEIIRCGNVTGTSNHFRPFPTFRPARVSFPVLARVDQGFLHVTFRQFVDVVVVFHVDADLRDQRLPRRRPLVRRRAGCFLVPRRRPRDASAPAAAARALRRRNPNRPEERIHAGPVFAHSRPNPPHRRSVSSCSALGFNPRFPTPARSARVLREDPRSPRAPKQRALYAPRQPHRPRSRASRTA